MNDAGTRDRSADERDIRALERAYDEAWALGDIERLTAVFTPDAVLVNPNGRVASGIAEIEAALRAYLSGDAASTQHTSRVKGVRFVTADVALVDGEANIEPPRGGAASPFVHSYTDVLVKRNGEWRICHVRAYTFVP